MALTDVDRSLLKRCIAQEPGAWKEFVDRFIGLFVHVVNHTAHSRSVKLGPEDVDDLCSEVFLAILADDYAVLRRFRGRSSLATYLSVISRRVIVRRISERRMAEALGHVNAHQASVLQADADVDRRRLEDQEEVEQLLNGLSERDASVVRAFFIEGKDYAQISRDTGISSNSVGSILNRARNSMRQRQVSS